MRQLVAATFIGLPVVDHDGGVVGFVTDTTCSVPSSSTLDASEQRALGPDAGADLLGNLERSGKLVSDVMRRPAIVGSPAASLSEAARRCTRME